MYVEPIPPIDPASPDYLRAEHQRLRWRIMYGQHEKDVRQRLVSALGSTRAAKVGPIDMTSNPALSVWTQAAALYDEEPLSMPPVGSEVVADMVAEAGYWQQMQRVQRDALALRCMPVRYDWTEAEGFSAQQVEPYYIQVQTDPRRQTVPRVVTEWRQRDGNRWARVIYDPGALAHYALDEHGADVSEEVLGRRFDGPDYPWLTAQGPILPWVFYRPRLTGWFWDAFAHREAIEGALQLGVLYTYYTHLVRHASWSQRWMANAQPVGATVTEGGETVDVQLDPANVFQVEAIDDGRPAQMGQWNITADPEAIMRSIITYERRLRDDIVGSAIATKASSDIRSGYSLAVSREAQRELQRSYGPAFARADVQLLRGVSGLMGLPMDGWRQIYQSLPRDPVDVQRDLERIEKAVALGLMDKVSGYMELHPGLTREQAQVAVDKIAGDPDATAQPLNGAQGDIVLKFLEAVSQQAIPRDAAVQSLAMFLARPKEEIEPMLGSAGAGFTPPTNE